MEKQTGKRLDLRGPQSRIGRLRHFYLEAYIHMLFNRILAPVSIIYGVVFLAWFLFPMFGPVVKALTIIAWILFTPVFLETAKGLALTSSRGLAFGHLNQEFAYLFRSRYRKGASAQVAFLLLVALLWLAGFVLMVVVWSP